MADDTKLSVSQRKRRKLHRDAVRRASLVNIGSNINRWSSLRDTLCLDNETLMAVLLDNYDKHQRCLTATESPILVTSTPKIKLNPDELDSESNRSDSEMSGIQMLRPTTSTDNASGVRSECSEIYSGDLQLDASHSFAEEISDNGSEEYHDPDDYTWEPSLTSIRLLEDSNLEYSQNDDHPGDMVFDTDIVEKDGLKSDEAEETVKGKIGKDLRLRQDNPTDAATSEKCIAYQSCLEQLSDLQVPQACPVKGCGVMVARQFTRKGTAFVISWDCKSGHRVRTWCSQPKLPRGILAGEFSLACCILLSGNNYGKVALMLKFLRLGCINSSSFFRIQTLYFTPTINILWERKLTSVIDQSKGKHLVIAGDGRMDIPGFSAKYCTYTVLNLDTLDILSIQVVDKRQVALKSPNMELKAFKDALVELKNKRLTVTEIVTDAHPSISSYVRKEQQRTKHTYDLWHGDDKLNRL